jgi:hypothetical protein
MGLKFETISDFSFSGSGYKVIFAEVVLRGFSTQCAMLSMIVKPVVLAVKNHLSMGNEFKFKTLSDVTLNIAMKRIYVGIFFWGGHMGKFLVNAFILQELY